MASGHEKILRKVEQDRAKGQLDRALTRLKEAIALEPREFRLVEEASRLCFQMGRTLEGVGLLRAAMKRFPESRAVALDMLEREFAAGKQLELAEILYDTYLAQQDFGKARDLVLALEDADRAKLLSKLRAKLASVNQDAPNDAARQVALLLAMALVLSALHHPDEVAAALDRVLDLDPQQTTHVGKLCKAELTQNPGCHPVQLVLARCYVNIGQPERAAEQVVNAGHDPDFKAKALAFVSDTAAPAPLRHARAELLLQGGQFEAAEKELEALVELDVEQERVVRQMLERVPGATHATLGLRQMYARALGSTGAARLAAKELHEARDAGADPAASLSIADTLLQHDPRNAELVVLRGRLALDAGRSEEAAADFAHAVELDPSRAETLRKELEKSFAKNSDPGLGRLLVDLYVQLDLPQEAAQCLCRLRDGRDTQPATLYDLASTVAAKYGLSAALLLVFVEAALDTDRDGEARAAVQHYLGFPGARMTEFAQLLVGLLHERTELGPKLARTLEGLPLPAELRFALATAGLAGADAERALDELETLLLKHPELRTPALASLEEYLKRHGDVLEALHLAAELCLDSGRALDAARHLARALRSAPSEADRTVKLADKVLSRAGDQPEVWSCVVLALVDARRQRHARDLCYRAAQVLPPDKLGFMHTALGEMLLEAGQVQTAAHELESALGCEDTPIDRLLNVLRRATALDAKQGYVRYVLAMALLRHRGDRDEAVQLLAAAVRQDDLLVDLALDLLAEHDGELEAHAAAQALEGTLQLRKGSRARGVLLLERAVQLQPELAPQVVQQLELEWDRDGSQFEVGIAFARALRASSQSRRACRLLSELAHRFPSEQMTCVGELERVIEHEASPEAHRAVWEILLERGDREGALQHVMLAVEGSKLEDERRRELLEVAYRQMPEVPWVVCRLAEFEGRTGNETRTESLLRALLERDPSAWETVRDSVLSCAPDSPASELLPLLEIDCLLAGDRGLEAVASLRRTRDAFPAARDAVLARYRVLATRGSARPLADLDLGLLLKDAGQVEEAVRAFEVGLERGGPRTAAGAASEASGADRELRLALASLYVELGRERDGRELLASVLDRPGDHGEAYSFLERVSRQSLVTKLENLRRTVSSSPENLRARLELARLSLVSMDFDAAREALGFSSDTPALETMRRYLLARSYADEDDPGLALAVLRSIDMDDVADQDLQRNVVYLSGVCSESLGRYGEAHSHYVQLLAQAPAFKDTRERARSTYRLHLETALETRAALLSKHLDLDVMSGEAV